MKRIALVALALAVALVPQVVAQEPPAEVEENIRAIGEVRRGEYVTVAGEVTRVRDYDTFQVEDETGRVQIYVRGGFSRPAVRSGETVIVTGWVDDVFGFRKEIYATQIVLEDGTVLEVRRGHY